MRERGSLEDEVERRKGNANLDHQAEVTSDSDMRTPLTPPTPVPLKKKKKKKNKKKVTFDYNYDYDERGSGSSEDFEYTNYLLNNTKKKYDLEFEKPKLFNKEIVMEEDPRAPIAVDHMPAWDININPPRVVPKRLPPEPMYYDDGSVLKIHNNIGNLRKKYTYLKGDDYHYAPRHRAGIPLLRDLQQSERE